MILVSVFILTVWREALRRADGAEKVASVVAEAVEAAVFEPRKNQTRIGQTQTRPGQSHCEQNHAGPSQQGPASRHDNQPAYRPQTSTVH